jgi:hypothetical protein
MKTLGSAAILSLIINGVTIFAAGYTETHYWYYAMFAIIATGLITFFGILIYYSMQNNENSMRLSITGLIVNSYIALLVYCLFIPSDIQLNDISKTLVTNFTVVVGTVVAFFFGSAAYIEAHKPRS